jgi:hypothetical protein
MKEARSKWIYFSTITDTRTAYESIFRTVLQKYYCYMYIYSITNYNLQPTNTYPGSIRSRDPKTRISSATGGDDTTRPRHHDYNPKILILRWDSNLELLFPEADVMTTAPCPRRSEIFLFWKKQIRSKPWTQLRGAFLTAPAPPPFPATPPVPIGVAPEAPASFNATSEAESEPEAVMTAESTEEERIGFGIRSRFYESVSAVIYEKTYKYLHLNS